MTSTTSIPSADDIAKAVLVQINQDLSGQYSSLRSALNNSPSMSVAQNNAVPLQNYVAATCTLIPPVTTDQHLLHFNGYNASSGTDEGTCNAVVPITFRSISLINNSLPLAYHITDKLRNSIFSEIYVDFTALLPNCNKSEEIYTIGQGIKLTTTGNTYIRSLTSIMQWCNAFDIFMSIYISKYTNLALNLIKYRNNIRKISVDHGFQAAKFYDEEFRKLRYVHRLEWTTVHDELWRLAMGQSRHSNNNSYAQAFLLKKNKSPFLGRTQQQPSVYPKGYCWKFCNTGQCTNQNCKHKHQCVHCDKKHATDTCKIPQTNKASNSN
jgi:hypothetical protein